MARAWTESGSPRGHDLKEGPGARRAQGVGNPSPAFHLRQIARQRSTPFTLLAFLTAGARARHGLAQGGLRQVAAAGSQRFDQGLRVEVAGRLAGSER